MTQIDSKKIAEIADRTPTAEAFMTYAACRTRNARDGVTPVKAIRQQLAKEGFHAVPQDLLRMFKELEHAGVGVLKNGEFKWDVPIREVGVLVSYKSPKADPQKPHIPKAMKNLIIAFPDNREVSIGFTPNLTKEDVAFLSQKILDECK